MFKSTQLNYTQQIALRVLVLTPENVLLPFFLNV